MVVVKTVPVDVAFEVHVVYNSTNEVDVNVLVTLCGIVTVSVAILVE